MNILVIGSGGREHALCTALRRSPHAGKIFSLPGNGGIHEIAPPAPVNPDDFKGIVAFCKKETVGLVVIGPEGPLVAGLADMLEAAGIPVFGCSKAAAQLEGSKRFMKEICVKYNIPTAEYRSFTDAKTAKTYVKEKGAPIVVKADGLAAGKGVVVAANVAEANAAIDEILGGKFGSAGASIVIEEFLQGEEASLFALCDGTRALLFGSAQDHKAVGDGDTGPNTGGMGTYSPTPIMTDTLHDQVMKEMINPTVAAMKKEGIPFKGVLFAGLMLTQSGPKLLEYNVRFGDPETQVLMPRLESDLVELFVATAKGNLAGKTVKLSNKTALCVVMAAKGYPGDYVKNTPIHNVDKAKALKNVTVFHAGTKYEGKQLLSTGGRVLGITALGDDVIEAQTNAYKAVDMIQWKEGFCRHDIGWRAVKAVKKKVS